ncbi:hypothetical protein V2I52_23015 [Brenneria sp. g21c3]|uniref:hypothetical protein n=1 Tax=Brenneria sp. g21c3 TaxID=3093893 RepID=UPI002EAA7DBD|nr:hypothetical protein [Brenneria sp. g21c3]
MEKDNVISILMSKYALWGIIALLVLAVIPTLLKCPEPWNGMLLNIGTSIFILLTISYYVNEKIKYHTNFEIKQLVENKFPVLVELEKQGLERIVYSNRMKEVGVDIVNSDVIYIVMNDGKNFLTSNSGCITERIKKPNKRTVIVLLDETSDSQSIFCKRNGKQEGHYITKVTDAVKILEDYHEYGSKEHNLEIYKYSHYFSLNIVVTTSKAVTGTYRNSIGKFEIPPSYIYLSGGSEYKSILADVERLISCKEMKKVYPSKV